MTKPPGPINKRAVLAISLERFDEWLQLPIGVQIADVKYDREQLTIFLVVEHPLLKAGEQLTARYFDDDGVLRSDWSQ